MPERPRYVSTHQVAHGLPDREQRFRKVSLLQDRVQSRQDCLSDPVTGVSADGTHSSNDDLALHRAGGCVVGTRIGPLAGAIVLFARHHGRAQDLFKLKFDRSWKQG